jgi:hypothetical protein
MLCVQIDDPVVGQRLPRVEGLTDNSRTDGLVSLPSLSGTDKLKLLQGSGVGEIRTHEGLSPLAVFKTAAFNHSATTPGGYNVLSHNGLFK